MRNLKRVLSLALALVMVLGMMVITTSAADFADDEKITYTEAVDVMAGVGLFKGDDKNNVNPTEVLTRQDAATLMARIMLGGKADKLVATKQIFTDVKTTDWAAKYIEYCYNTGLIGGYTQGGELVFNPEGKLTGVAFAKLLLCAMGYNADAQGYGGSNWASAIAADAFDAGLTIDGVAISAELTREQAAQMILQALPGKMVEYRTSYDYATGAAVLVGPFDTKDGDTFHSEYFPKLEKVTGVINAVDAKGTTLGSTKVSATNVDWTDIGYQAYNWILNGQKENVRYKTSITDIIITGESLGINTDGASYADMTNEKKDAFIAEMDDEYDLYYNGILAASYNWNKAGTKVVKTVVNAAANTAFDKALGKIGAKVDFVDNDNAGKAEAVVVTEYTYTTVENVVRKSVSGVVSVDHYDLANDVEIDAEDLMWADELTRGDHITYVVYGGKYYVTVLEEAEGEFEYITREKLNNETVKVYTIDGADYVVSELDDVVAADFLKTNKINEDIVYVVDEYGYIVYAGDPAADPDSFLFVIDNDDSHGIKDIAETEVAFVDGTVDIVNVDCDKDIADGELADAIYTYTVKNGNYVLKATNFDVVDEVTYATKKLVMAGERLTLNTTVIDLRDYLAGDADEGTVYVGYKEIPSFVDGTIYYLTANGKMTLAFLTDGKDPAAAGVESSFVVFNTETNIVDEEDGALTYELEAGVLVAGEVVYDYILTQAQKDAIDALGVGAYAFNKDGSLKSYTSFAEDNVIWTPESSGALVKGDEDITDDWTPVFLNIEDGEVNDWWEYVDEGTYYAYFDKKNDVVYIVADEDVTGDILTLRSEAEVAAIFGDGTYYSAEGQVTQKTGNSLSTALGIMGEVLVYQNGEFVVVTNP